MGVSQSVLGPRLGRLHAWRDRGAIYTDGVRTSVQAGLLGAGVAKGAQFTDAWWAVVFGCAIILGLELGKIALGWLDFRFRIIHTQQAMVTEANPITMRQVEALERLSPPPPPPPRCHCPSHLDSCLWRQWRDEKLREYRAPFFESANTNRGAP